MRRLSDSAIALDDGDQWKDSYTTGLGNQIHNHVSASAVDEPYVGVDDSEEGLRVGVGRENSSAIVKSTRIVVESNDM